MKITTIPKSRLLLLALTLALVPSIWILANLQSNFDRCAFLETQVLENIELAQKLSPLLSKQYEIRKNLKGVDLTFVNKHLETFIPLTGETDSLKERAQRGFLPDEESLKRRLDFLNSGQNGITYVEGTIQQNRGVKATIENQTKPVEMSPSDVSEFLYRIEGNSNSFPNNTSSESSNLKRPHLQILECRIERKKQPQGQQQQSGGEVYLFSSKLLKQECVE